MVMPSVSASWKPSVPEQLGAHLAGDEDDRHRVHHRVGDRRDQVGRAGAGGREAPRRPCRSPWRSPRRRGRRPPRGGPGRGGSRRRRRRRRSAGWRHRGGRIRSSTPSAFRHSITASTARMRLNLLSVLPGDADFGPRTQAQAQDSVRERVFLQLQPGGQPGRVLQMRADAHRRVRLDDLGLVGILELGAAAHAQRVVVAHGAAGSPGTAAAPPRSRGGRAPRRAVPGTAGCR